jgi:hypothetical protein
MRRLPEVDVQDFVVATTTWVDDPRCVSWVGTVWLQLVCADAAGSEISVRALPRASNNAAVRRFAATLASPELAAHDGALFGMKSSHLDG